MNCTIRNMIKSDIESLMVFESTSSGKWEREVQS